MSATSSTLSCVLLAGSAGTGKTTLCRLGHRAMVSAWGHPAAAIDLDTLYSAVDARWELPYSATRNVMILHQAASWVTSLMKHEWSVVIVAGNSIFDPADTAPFVAALRPEVAVHHITLRLREEVLIARSADQPGRDAERLISDHRPANRLAHPGTSVLDSSDLDAIGTLDALVQLVRSGSGLLTRN